MKRRFSEKDYTKDLASLDNECCEIIKKIEDYQSHALDLLGRDGVTSVNMRQYWSHRFQTDIKAIIQKLEGLKISGAK